MNRRFSYGILLCCFLTSVSADLKANDLMSAGRFAAASVQRQDSVPTCREMECPVFIHVVKSRQRLYLYVNGALTDTFRASTGTRRHPTPNINMRPQGPTFVKYTSRKFPGGNYKGLGNMPYAIFIKGGYAIHGTTPGNFLKLGHRASHGCIRLHPDNARKLFELVNSYGLQNTWVKVHE